MSVTAAELEKHRAALVGHCYRMMGSIVDADDAVQETLVRALRGLEKFEERSALRTWLHRIATNVCLDMLGSRERRVRPLEELPPGTIEGPFDSLPGGHWIEPAPDARVVPADADPAEALAIRQSVRLAFVAALQRLPPKQRAALLFAEVLGWPVAEIAEALDLSVASVNSALQRARATLEKDASVAASPGALTAEQARLVERYTRAFLDFDVDGLVALLHDDATLNMPPMKLWLRGRETIRAWLNGPGGVCRGSKLVPLAGASGAPAFGQYHDLGATPWAVLVLDVAGDKIAGWTAFLDVATLFPRFGLPPRLAS